MKIEIINYVKAINELYDEFSRATENFEKHRYSVAMAIMADQLIGALKPIIEGTKLENPMKKETVGGYQTEPLPTKTARIYQFKQKE